MTSNKIYTQKINRHFFGTKYGTFHRWDLAKSWLEMSKMGKFYCNIAFLKKELNWNWLEKLRVIWNHWESPLYLNRERLRPFIIQDRSYDYEKSDKYRQKLKICTKNYARKRCPLNQLDINVITKNNKKLRLDCLKATTFANQMTPIFVILWKENKNLQKGANMQKSRKLVLWKLVVRRRKTIWGKQPLCRAK